jgi:hypothetical protein
MDRDSALSEAGNTSARKSTTENTNTASAKNVGQTVQEEKEKERERGGRSYSQ